MIGINMVKYMLILTDVCVLCSVGRDGENLRMRHLAQIYPYYCVSVWGGIV